MLREGCVRDLVIDLASLPDEELSLAERIAIRPPEQHDQILAGFSKEKIEGLEWDWEFWGRPDQIPPNEYSLYAYIAGRGSGKTRGISEEINRLANGRRRLFAFVAPTPADARDIMIEGPAGVMNVSHPSLRPTYEPTKRRLTWENGSRATVYSGAEPADLRGANVDVAWVEEPCKFKYLNDAWSNLRLAMRGSGWNSEAPRTLISSTPVPLPFFKDLKNGKYPGTIYRQVSTYRNIANLPPEFVAELLATYEGTRLGRQELYADILDDVEGALWTLKLIDELRVSSSPELVRIVVAVDPSGTTFGDECGIIVVGIAKDGHLYVLEDLSGHYAPDEWAQVVVSAYHRYEADKVVAEINFGADMVETILRTIDRNIPFEGIRASRGKMQRMEPVAALYERGLVHHVGNFLELETQMTEWVPGLTTESPDRADALVWGCTVLALMVIAWGSAGFVKPATRSSTLITRRVPSLPKRSNSTLITGRD